MSIVVYNILGIIVLYRESKDLKETELKGLQQ